MYIDLTRPLVSYGSFSSTCKREAAGRIGLPHWCHLLPPSRPPAMEWGKSTSPQTLLDPKPTLQQKCIFKDSVA